VVGNAAVGRRYWSRVLLFPLLLCSQILAQEAAPAQPAAFLRSNDKFAMNLLTIVHEGDPDRNVTVAPLPLSLTFAALMDGSTDSKSTHEIATAFQWDGMSTLNSASRMLLARFEKPKPRSGQSASKSQGAAELSSLPSGKPEESWISAAFLYRVEGSLSQNFIDRVKYDFGFDFRPAGVRASQSEVLAKNWDSSLPMPVVTGRNDFWITSFTHLRTSWMGNTFVGAKREKHDFRLQSGSIIRADFLKSEFNVYPHARTEDFEAVVLSCWEASILLVVPAQDRDIGQLESALTNDPRMIESLLARTVGDVQLPPFHFTYEGDLRNFLEKMGVRSIFNSGSNTLQFMVPGEGGVLRGVVQKSEIAVDEEGIRADAGTIFHGIYGGIMGNPAAPFHLILDRPFLFIVRDRVTNALLFTGIVMNPALP
jgi:serpin B